MKRDMTHLPTSLNSRGLSVVAGYTATLAMTAIILAAVIGGGNAIVSGQTNIIATDQLETAGGTLTDEVNTVHRLATDPDETNQKIVSTVELPERTVEGQYFIKTTTNEVTLTTANTDITVVRPYSFNADGMSITTDGRIEGGTVQVCYSGGDEIEISNQCATS